MTLLRNQYGLIAFFVLLQFSILQKVESQEAGPLSKGPENGHLIIAGGALSDTSVFNLFIGLSGGCNAPVVVIPTAAEDAFFDNDSALIILKSTFMSRGFNNITILHTRDRSVANSEEFAQPVREAGGVWFMGGRQWRLADSYLDTKIHRELERLLGRGGVIGGSSAGATIQGSFLARGDTKTNTIMVGDHVSGLGFLKNTTIDQHLLARNRQFDMFEILKSFPYLLGIGLDENTAIHVHGDQFEVLGESYVAIYDGTRWSAERDTIYKLPGGATQYYYLKPGQKYNIKDRRVVVD